LTPAASTLTSTWPGPGTGGPVSRATTEPSSPQITARIRPICPTRRAWHVPGLAYVEQAGSSRFTVADMSFVPERQRSEGLAKHGARALTSAVLVGAVTAVMWVLEAIDYAMNGWLDRFGIQPRDVSDLPDVFTAPFMHGGFGHLMANTVPFLILGFIAAARGIAKF